MPISDEDLNNDEGMPDEYKQKKLPYGLNEKRNKHQLLIAPIYNKLILLHLSPLTNEVYIHELDPNMTFKYSQSIPLNKSSSLHNL